MGSQSAAPTLISRLSMVSSGDDSGLRTDDSERRTTEERGRRLGLAKTRSTSRKLGGLWACICRIVRVRSLLQRPGDRSQPGKGGFWKRSPAPPDLELSFGSEPGSEVLRDRRSARHRNVTGTLAPLRRDGGPHGTRIGNMMRMPSGRGPKLRLRNPAADLFGDEWQPTSPQGGDGAIDASAEMVAR